MADKPAAKPAKSPSKVFDVAKPGKQAADSTSRPVIVSNRPLMQDPMMLSNASMAESAANPGSNSSGGSSPSAVKVKIQPLTAAEKKQDAEPKSTGLPTAIKLVDESVASDKQIKPTAPDVVEVSVVSPEKAQPKTPEEPAKEKPADTPKKSTELEDHSEPVITEEDSPAEENTEPSTDNQETPESQESNESPADTGTQSDSASFGTSDDILPAGEEGINQKATAEIEADAKRQEALDELVDNETYFLPLNSVEKRRSVISAIFGLILIIALGLLLINLLMDVGTIQIDGVKPLTNFFG